ncbi:MAG: carboxypeptidase-like regulatory domain-containing protein [Burkholderiales bacterium]|nr:carboxypeptidase-like regulatory domain-containing protein [Burkholderiales bacterium]
MKPDLISLQRRQLMIAGTAMAAVPAAWFAATRTARAAPANCAAAPHATTMVVSGRLIAADGRPLAGAAVLAWPMCGKPGIDRCGAISDADGRFVFSSDAPHQSADGLQPMHVYVTPPAGGPHYAELHFERGGDTGNSVHARTLLDHDTLRASFELTLS